MTSFDIDKIHDSDYLLEILISVEDILDSTDSYVFKGVLDGEIVEGPIVRRHWVTIGIRYKDMPDPRFALRLLRMGIQVEFNKVQQQEPTHAPGVKVDKPADQWIVMLTVPRRLLDQSEEAELEPYDDDLNTDDVGDAKDTGMDDESSLHRDEQIPGQMGGPPGGAPEPPGAPPPAPPA